MTSAIMIEETAAEMMRPLPPPIRIDATAAEARARMEAEELSHLVVVSTDTEKLLGIVLLTALERACESNGHDPEDCPLVRHLKADIDFCFVTETVAEAVGREPDLKKSTDSRAARRARLRRSLPVVVVDAQKVPVGYLER